MQKEFSKRVLNLCMALFFVTALYGFIYCWKFQTGFESLLLFVGLPITADVIMYYVKAANENIVKIKKSKEVN